MRSTDRRWGGGALVCVRANLKAQMLLLRYGQPRQNSIVALASERQATRGQYDI